MNERETESATPPASPSATPVEHAATPLELAMLAALIDPAACNEGGCRDALFRAMTLFQESVALCYEMGKKSHLEQIEFLTRLVVEGQKGAGRLCDVLHRIRSNAPASVLTLASKNGEQDTLRPYLEEHCNFEGKTRKKSWSRVRTVLDNLRCWWISCANEHNTSNAVSIQARDIRDDEIARAKGCSVEELRRRGWGYYESQRWNDAEREFKEFLARHEQWKNRKLAGYSFPRETMDEFIKWKRSNRQKGGMRAVRPLTREEVFAEPVKENIPKSAK